MSDETPDRYTPDDCGRYSVNQTTEKGWNTTRQRVRCELGRSVLDALDAEGGDVLVFRRNDRGEMVVEVDHD